MFDLTRTLVLVVSAALASGGAALAVGLIGTPGGTGAGADFGLDTNGNGKYDWLVVEASVHLPESGVWDIGGTLSANTSPTGGSCSVGFERPFPVTQAAQPIAYVYERYFFDAGDQTVRLAFTGTEIFRAGADGPYDVGATFSLNGGIVYYDVGILPPEHESPYILWNYTTRAYRAVDFEEPVRPAYFTGGHSDRGVHVDGDGLYDLFELTADVRVNTPGTYGLSGVLSIQKGSDAYAVMTIAYTSREVRLDTRDTSVSLRFRGDQIRMAGVDGPWDFALTLYPYGPYEYGRNGTVTMSHPIAVYPEVLCGQTGGYRASEFDDTAELTRFTGAFEEAVVDWDGDGLYEGLVVRAEVEVYVATGLDMAGILRSGDGSTDITHFGAQAWLPEGFASTDWFFSGGAIRASGIDGPYEAALSMTPSLALDPTTTYRTKAYRATDFEGDASTRPGYWISNLSASGYDGGLLGISVEVQRGHDFLTYVIEDTLTVVVYDGQRTEVFRALDRVYLPGSGSMQSFGYKVEGLVSGTYTVVAILGSENQPVDVQVLSVSL